MSANSPSPGGPQASWDFYLTHCLPSRTENPTGLEPLRLGLDILLQSNTGWWHRCLLDVKVFIDIQAEAYWYTKHFYKKGILNETNARKAKHMQPILSTIMLYVPSVAAQWTNRSTSLMMHCPKVKACLSTSLTFFLPFFLCSEVAGSGSKICLIWKHNYNHEILLLTFTSQWSQDSGAELGRESTLKLLLIERRRASPVLHVPHIADMMDTAMTKGWQIQLSVLSEPLGRVGEVTSCRLLRNRAQIPLTSDDAFRRVRNTQLTCFPLLGLGVQVDICSWRPEPDWFDCQKNQQQRLLVYSIKRVMVTLKK